MKEYRFDSVNSGTVTITVTGEYRDGCKDVSVEVEGTGAYREFEDVDGGSADEMFQWLLDKGVEFESNRSLWFNVHYVASVLLDGDATEGQLLDQAANLTDEECDDYREFCLQA